MSQKTKNGDRNKIKECRERCFNMFNDRSLETDWDGALVNCLSLCKSGGGD